MELLETLPAYAPSKQLIHGQVEQLQRAFPSLTPRRGTLFDVRALVVLGGTVPISFRGASYNVPVEIFLVEAFPTAAPHVYVRPTSDMMIKPSHGNVHPDGLVFLPSLHSWDLHTHTLTNLVREMCSVFSSEPPCFARPAGQPAAEQPQQPPPGQVSPPQCAQTASSRLVQFCGARGTLALKSVHGKFLSAQPDGRARWDRDCAQGWETFHVEPRGDNKVCLWARAPGMYVSAQLNGSVQINRASAPANGWEEFLLEERGGVICLKSCHGKYLSAQPNGTAQCNSDRAPPGGCEELLVMRVGPVQTTANPLNGTPLAVRNLAHYVARSTLFDASQSGTAAALPTDLAAGWAVLTEQSWRDFGFFAIQSHPILSIACQHRNHPTPRLKRLFVQFLVGCYMFYMVMYYMLHPMSAEVVEIISNASFGYCLALFYSYFANMPCMQRDGASAEDKERADKCTRIFLGVMCLVSISTLGEIAVELGKFSNGGESYCDKCTNATSEALRFDPSKSNWNCSALPGTHSNPIATPYLYKRLCPWHNPFVPWLIAYAAQWCIALLQAPVMFAMRKRYCSKVLAASAQTQGLSGAHSMVEPLNIALQAKGLKPFDPADAQSKAAALQFMAVARRSGDPYKLCGSYGEVDLAAAVLEFKEFLAEVSEQESGDITMVHVCGWCGWQLDGGNMRDMSGKL